MFANAYERQWEEVEETICGGIERNRKSDVKVEVVDAAGKAVAGTQVSIEQTESAYLFGANAFMLGGYPSRELNEGYEKAFVGLFNAATVPFYWRDLEPTPGELRLAADSRPIYRRPAPDAVVAFCQAHGLNMNGHCLVWDFIKWSMPDWWPDDLTEGKRLLEKRIREIAQRYGDVIKRWDVVNEALLTPERLERKQSRVMPENYELLAFLLAEKYFPADTHLMINEISAVWAHWGERYATQVRDLLARGAKIRGVGMQFHLFTDAEMKRMVDGEIYRPGDMLKAMDRVGAIGLPIHVSEITLTAFGNDEAGQRAQARVARNLYRLWFSHARTHAITWWNLPDGGAAPGEDSVASGLVTREMKPKIGYEALRDLIRREWRTNVNVTTDHGGEAGFRGFHGKYVARVAGKGDAAFEVKPGVNGAVRVLVGKETVHVG